VGAAPQDFLSEQREEAFDEVQPRRVCRCEVEVEPRVAREPALHGRGLVRGEVVEHDVNREVWVDEFVDLAKEGDEIRAAMLSLAPSDDFAGGDIECSEEVESAVTQVVVRAPFGLPEIHRQHRLSTFQRLNLRLLVEREDRGVRWGFM
jgi:hypothetical protein